MFLANYENRAIVRAGDGGWIDLEVASNGTFSADISSVYPRWSEVTAWAAGADLSVGTITVDEQLLGAPAPSPTQVFAVGLNYSEHVAESGFARPDELPPVFPKYQSSITGPNTTVVLPTGGDTDWEIELAVVIGATASRVSEADAWNYVAGVTAAQDISERKMQLSGPVPQFGLAKSFAGFTPTGPWLVTPDELADRNDLRLGSKVDGVEVQNSSTKHMIFPVAVIIEKLSHIVTLYPGDLILTGTPDGVGLGMKPPRYLKDGEVLESWIDGIGTLRQVFVSE